MSQWLNIPCPSVNLDIDKPKSFREQMEEDFIKRGWSLDDLKAFSMDASGTDDDGDDDGDTGDDTDDDDDDGSDDDADDDDDGADDDSDKDKDKGTDKNASKIKKLSDENARWRNRFKAEKKAREELDTRLKKLEQGNGGDNKDVKVLTEERDTLKATNADLQKRVNEMSVRDAVRDGMAEQNLNPKKAKAIIKLALDDEDVEVDEDGTVTGIDSALERIAEEYPEWVNSDDDEDKGKNKSKGTGSSGAGPSGKQTNGSKTKKDGLDKASLEAKFPALRR